MESPEALFEDFQSRHPRRIRVERLVGHDLELYDRIPPSGKLKTEHYRAEIVTRKVRPWIDWKAEMLKADRKRVAKILRENQSEEVDFLQIEYLK